MFQGSREALVFREVQFVPQIIQIIRRVTGALAGRAKDKGACIRGRVGGVVATVVGGHDPLSGWPWPQLDSPNSHNPS